MLTRSHKKLVALIALFAMMFASLMPATSAFARTLSPDYAYAYAASGSICTTHDTHTPAPVAPMVHQHCVFCTLGGPAVLVPRAVVLVTRVDAPAAVPPVQRNNALPPDAVALHPLSARAPPRAV